MYVLWVQCVDRRLKAADQLLYTEMSVLWVQCVDRRLKAADQLLYTEEEGMLHVALIAANVKRSVQIYL
jgi:carbonic anhydrase